MKDFGFLRCLPHRFRKRDATISKTPISESPMQISSLATNDCVVMLQLPPEIIYLIIENLALQDKLYLSQTCTALRRIMFCDWRDEMSQLSLEDKFEFWTGVAHHSPIHWACEKCCRLHLVDTSAIHTLQRARLPCGARLREKRISNGYCIQHHHVQFALKLSRLGNMEQKYLATLMTPFNTKWKIINPLRYTAEPRIINGRFIFREEWMVRGNGDIYLPWYTNGRLQNTRATRPGALFQNENISICPHLCLRNGLEKILTWRGIVGAAAVLTQSWTIRPRVITVLEDGIRLALQSPGRWVFISCPRCPTDCGIIVSEERKLATIQAWHDFGPEGPATDISWKVHVKTSIYDDWLYQGISLDYAHGSIRALWLENDIAR